MKKLLLGTALLLLAGLSANAAPAASCDTVRVSEFGIRPNTYQSITVPLQQALQACKERGARVLLFDAGRYDIWPEGAARREWFISNTSTESECPSKVKTVGMLLEEMHDLTIEGNGATLMFHGKMITIAVARSSGIRLHDLHVDFERPGMSEMTCLACDSTGTGGTTLAFHRDARYDIDAAGRIHLYGEGWRANVYHCIEYDPATQRSTYSTAWERLAGAPAREVSPGVVHFATPAGFALQPGRTLSVRDIIRDHVGIFLYESRDVVLEDVQVHYMQGLGIVSQYTRNISMLRVQCAPREGSGRLIASSADFMHFSGCSGKIKILDCRFAGAHDDPVNVHGTNLRAVEKRAANRLLVRFMHGQSYGFKAFDAGDTVAFVRAATMERTAQAVVRRVHRESDRTIELTFDRAVPADLLLGSDCVENLTATPEVEIRGCRFTRTNTRGTLMTTPRRVVIADNVYCKTGMSAILIEGDASGWYESGPVCDVLIENNTFIDCGYVGGPAHAVIALHPSNTVIDPERPVHRNVRIRNNRFVTFGNPVLYAKSTADLCFEGNDVTLGTADGAPETVSPRATAGPQFVLQGCKDAVIRNNRLPE